MNTKKKNKIDEDYLKDKDYPKYSKKYDDLTAEFRYPENSLSEKVSIKNGETKFLTLTRNNPKGLTYDDLNINVFIISDNDDISLFTLNFRTSNLKSPYLSLSTSSKEEIKTKESKN
jgi:hypothetical protein